LFLRMAKGGTPGGVVLLSTVFTTVVALVGAGIIAPSLNSLLSTRNQGELLGMLAERGYYAATYRVYPGVYTYYARRNIPNITSEADLDTLAFRHGHQGLALAMSAKNWN